MVDPAIQNRNGTKRTPITDKSPTGQRRRMNRRNLSPSSLSSASPSMSPSNVEASVAPISKKISPNKDFSASNQAGNTSPLGSKPKNPMMSKNTRLNNSGSSAPPSVASEQAFSPGPMERSGVPLKPGASFDHLIIMAFEVTCDEGPNLAITAQNQEIIEFPYVVFDLRNQKVVEEVQMLIKPQWIENLPQFTTKITGITDKQLESGISLSEAIRRFDLYISTLKQKQQTFCILTDGRWDLKLQLRREAKKKNITLGEHFNRYLDLQTEFQRCYRYYKRVHLKKMMQYLGLNMMGRSHSGIDDCKTIAMIVSRMAKDGYLFQNPEVIPTDYDAESDVSFRDYNLSRHWDDSNIVKLRGLPWTVTEEDIRSFFSGLSIGEKEDSENEEDDMKDLDVVIDCDSRGFANGIGYVRFSNEADWEKACEYSGNYMGSTGRYIDVHKSSKKAMIEGKKRRDSHSHVNTNVGIAGSNSGAGVNHGGEMMGKKGHRNITVNNSKLTTALASNSSGRVGANSNAIGGGGNSTASNNGPVASAWGKPLPVSHFKPAVEKEKSGKDQASSPLSSSPVYPLLSSLPSGDHLPPLNGENKEDNSKIENEGEPGDMEGPTNQPLIAAQSSPIGPFALSAQKRHHSAPMERTPSPFFGPQYQVWNWGSGGKEWGNSNNAHPNNNGGNVNNGGWNIWNNNVDPMNNNGNNNSIKNTGGGERANRGGNVSGTNGEVESAIDLDSSSSSSVFNPYGYHPLHDMISFIDYDSDGKAIRRRATVEVGELQYQQSSNNNSEYSYEEKKNDERKNGWSPFGSPFNNSFISGLRGENNNFKRNQKSNSYNNNNHSNSNNNIISSNNDVNNNSNNKNNANNNNSNNNNGNGNDSNNSNSTNNNINVHSRRPVDYDPRHPLYQSTSSKDLLEEKELKSKQELYFVYNKNGQTYDEDNGNNWDNSSNSTNNSNNNSEELMRSIFAKNNNNNSSYSNNNIHLISDETNDLSSEDENNSSVSKVIRMRGLPWRTSQKDVVDFFSPVVELSEIDVHLVRRSDGRLTGDGFVVFVSENESRKAMEGMNKKYMGRRYIELFYCHNFPFRGKKKDNRDGSS